MPLPLARVRASAKLHGLAAVLALCWAMSLTLSAPASANPLRKADKALAAGDYDGAYAEYLRHAEEKDDHLAQFNLALFHDYGWGRPVDPVAACRWHERAAAGGIPYAAHRLAECLAEGVGRPADPEAAARWYRKAADLQHHISLCDLGEMHLRGEGVEKDPEKAVALCTEAAERGLAPAQLRLAGFYVEGDAEIRDAVLAARWLEAAARQGLAEAQYRLGALLHERGDAEPATRDVARYWLESAASQGYLDAYLPVAEAYLARPRDPSSGRLPADDLAKAYLWLSAAAHRLEEPESKARADTLLAEVRAVMPPSWAPSLDAQVEAHLEEVAHEHPLRALR